MLAPVEITVGNGCFTKPYYTCSIGGSVIDISTYGLIPGHRYKFVRQSGVTSLPFFISDNGQMKASIFTAFNRCITGGGYLEFQPPSNFVGPLTYYCVPHDIMTNTFRILTTSPTLEPMTQKTMSEQPSPSL
jgi:hypothetical protein